MHYKESTTFFREFPLTLGRFLGDPRNFTMGSQCKNQQTIEYFHSGDVQEAYRHEKRAKDDGGNTILRFALSTIFLSEL